MGDFFGGLTQAPSGSRSESGYAGTTELNYGGFRIQIDANTIGQDLAVMSEALSDDSAVMRLIATDMQTLVKANIAAGPGPALTAESVKRKRRAGQSPTPLMGTGALHGGIVARSRKGYAAAKRGRDQWYGFLHEFGMGRLEDRPFMGLTGAEMDWLSQTYEDWILGVLELGGGE